MRPIPRRLLKFRLFPKRKQATQRILDSRHWGSHWSWCQDENKAKLLLNIFLSRNCSWSWPLSLGLSFQFECTCLQSAGKYPKRKRVRLHYDKNLISYIFHFDIQRALISPKNIPSPWEGRSRINFRLSRCLNWFAIYKTTNREEIIPSKTLI